MKQHSLRIHNLNPIINSVFETNIKTWTYLKKTWHKKNNNRNGLSNLGNIGFHNMVHTHALIYSTYEWYMCVQFKIYSMFIFMLLYSYFMDQLFCYYYKWIEHFFFIMRSIFRIIVLLTNEFPWFNNNNKKTS